MRHYEPLARIHNVDEYEDYDGWFYYADKSCIHIRASFDITKGRRVKASVIFMGIDAEHGDELWNLPVDVPVAVARLETVLGLPSEQLVALTQEDLDRLIEAINSHQYWQLSDEQYRSNGNVLEPGSDDPEASADICAYDTLSQKLATYQREEK